MKKKVQKEYIVKDKIIFLDMHWKKVYNYFVPKALGFVYIAIKFSVKMQEVHRGCKLFN